jgi:hypothetical protein
MHGPLQYGEGLKAFVIHLAVCQMVALNRIQKLLGVLIGEVISENTLLKFILRLHDALADWEASAIERILASPAIHVDETSLRVDKKNQWIHVYAAGDMTLKFLHRKRGKEAIEAINIIPRHSGNIIHDCWASYLSYDHCNHGLCGSHLLRELTFIIDANGYAWARNMKRLLQESCVNVSKSPEKTLEAKALANLQKRYRNILTRGAKELPAIPPKTNGKRGLWQNQMRIIFSNAYKSTRHPYCASPKNRMCRLPITGLNAISGCQRSSKRFPAVFGPKSMPRPIAAFQAICKQWQTKDITRLLPSNWLWLENLMFKGE